MCSVDWESRKIYEKSRCNHTFVLHDFLLISNVYAIDINKKLDVMFNDNIDPAIARTPERDISALQSIGFDLNAAITYEKTRNGLVLFF